ncbi:pilus assembly protein CpaB [Aeromicrobium panaciterrae]|uniref:Pilus assembly protein CpaB n=1 Tax=Aeromicrobium panaciterrae TaxID=363861 RepID=A0ABU1ULL2_9ACTN|nr:RcpC/CpaB family pilus assembly protein [Aeromicrobium panaciterrae]MDR7086072.1 pilus assembly protein CpaB [Aeromicrobium panaciterrae]
MKKKLVAIVSAAVLAIMGIIALVNYANGADERAFDGAQLVEVLVVKDEIPAETPASRITTAVELKKVPVSVRAEGALTSLDSVRSLSTNVSLKPGEQLLKARFGALTGKDGKSSSLPAGMQEVSISLSAPRMPTGTIKAGDRVGLVVSYAKQGNDGGYTNVIKNNLLVTRVSQSALGKVGADEAGVPSLVTFAVDPLDAERIVNAAEFGKVWLTLQNSQTDTSGSKMIESKDVVK